MAVKTWNVMDTATNAHVEDLVIRPSEGSGDWRNCTIAKRTLRAGPSANVATVHVNNGRLSFEVLPTRGMGIWKAWIDGQAIGWQSPVRGPVHPQFVPWNEPGGLGWLDGFDELLVRCGLESNGAPEFDDRGRVRYPLHGRIANRPAHRVDIETDSELGEIRIIGEVDECRFLFHKLRLRTIVSTRLGETALRIRDEIINLSEMPGSAQMLYHVNFGPPLLDANARFLAPAATVAPRDPRAAEGIATWDRYAAPETGYAEQVYFLKLHADAAGSTQALLRNAAGTLGTTLHFNVQQLPCFTLWKNTSSLADGYVTGLEPATNYPNTRSFEEAQSRVVRLPPQGSYTIDLGMTLHADVQSVKAAEQAIQQIQAGRTPQIFERPQPGWSAAD